MIVEVDTVTMIEASVDFECEAKRVYEWHVTVYTMSMLDM